MTDIFTACLPRVTETIPGKVSAGCERLRPPGRSQSRGAVCCAWGWNLPRFSNYFEGCCIFNVVSVTKAACQECEYQIAATLSGAADRIMLDTTHSLNESKCYNWRWY